MGILSFAVFAAISVVKIQSDISTSESHGRKARALAEKGIALASHSATKNGDPLLNFNDTDYAEGYSAKMTSLSSTFGLNVLISNVETTLTSNTGTLSSTLLYQIFTEAWGMDSGDAQTFIHCLVEWVDPDDRITTISGWERSNYENEGFIGFPYNRSFKSLEEVENVHGYEALAEVKPDWKDFFNIWTDGQIDLTSASPEIISLASITEFGRAIDVTSATQLQEQLIGEDGISGTKDDLPNPNLDQLLDESSNNNTSQIRNRYIIEGQSPAFGTLTSRGWSGSVQITIILSLQTQSNQPLILDRKEILSTRDNEN